MFFLFLMLKLIKLKNTKPFKMSGFGTKNMLQGLTTNNLDTLKQETNHFTTFLNQKGRILCSSFVFRKDEDFIIDCFHSNILKKHINNYILRQNIEFTDLDVSCYQLMENVDYSFIKNILQTIFTPLEYLLLIDNRHKILGYRLFINKQVGIYYTY